MIRPAVAVGLSLFLTAALAHAGRGQTMGMGGSPSSSRFGALNSSGFGVNSFGTSGFGNAGFGASRFGSTGMGGFGSGFGTSGFGNAGFGASRFGSGGMGGVGSGSVFGNQGFGMSGMAGQNFVGRDAADMQALNQMGQAGTQFFNQMNRNFRRERNRQTTPTVTNTPQAVRVQLQVGFAAPQPAPTAVEARVQARLAKILAEHNMAQPLFRMEGDTAVLSGVAASESERMVLERLVALEPGVRQVRNEMIVAGATAAEPAGP